MVIQKDFELSKILWYKVGGIAKYLLDAENTEDVKKALDFIEKNNIQNVFVCGLGSNLIFSDDYFDGAVIRIVKSQKTADDLHIKDEFTSVFAGTILNNLIEESFENKRIGLEWAGGLPGTVGAGIRGNVGAFGKEIKESIISADVLERRREGFVLHTIKNDELKFSYRNSLIKENNNLIVISATFLLHPAGSEELKSAKKIYTNNNDYRKLHHPIEYPTCGSVFKNIVANEEIEKIISVWPDAKELIETKWHGKVSMGYIIKRLGFSSFRIGNMQVSEKHANFIVNLGNAKASDVLTIIREIQGKTQETLGFIPEVEAEIIRTTEKN